MPRSIRRTRNQFAYVDDDGFIWLDQWKWQTTSDGYAAWVVCTDGTRQTIRMHRLILDAPPG